jgi:hypothetical protein
MRPR